MKNLLSIACALFLFSFLSSCDQEDPIPEPQASFTIDKIKAEEGEVLTFTNTSRYASSFSWEFGDGNTSGDDHPSHAYEEAGNYTIKLVASGAGGLSESSQSVEITAPPFNIIPGERIGEFILGDNISTHQNKIEETWAQHVMIQMDNGNYLHLLAYSETGIGFFLETYSGTLSGSDIPYSIYASDPFEGNTEGGITFWSPLTQVVEVFGQPDEITSTGSYSYLSSLGISFWADDSETMVEDIYISAPGSEKRAKADLSEWEQQLLLMK